MPSWHVASSALEGEVKVVCINAQNNPGRRWLGDPPMEGAIYTVIGEANTAQGHPGFLLAEIKNNNYGSKVYAACRFRPVKEDKKPTDIAIFRKICDDVNNGVVREIKEDA